MDSKMEDSPPLNYDTDNPTINIAPKDASQPNNHDSSEIPPTESAGAAWGHSSFKDTLLQGQQPSTSKGYYMETVTTKDGEVKYGEVDGLTTIAFADPVQQRMNRAMTYSVAVKPLGREFPYYLLHKRLRAMWRPKGEIHPSNVINGIHMFWLSNEEDYNHVLLNGPWSIKDHYINVLPWTSDFDPTGKNISAVPTWIRIPGLPLKYFHEAILRDIARPLGRFIKDPEYTNGTNGGATEAATAGKEVNNVHTHKSTPSTPAESAKETNSDANSGRIETLESKFSNLDSRFTSLESKVDSLTTSMEQMLDLVGAMQQRNPEKAPVTEVTSPASPAPYRPPFAQGGVDNHQTSFKATLEKGNRRSPVNPVRVDVDHQTRAGNFNRNSPLPEFTNSGGVKGDNNWGQQNYRCSPGSVRGGNESPVGNSDRITTGDFLDKMVKGKEDREGVLGTKAGNGIKMNGYKGPAGHVCKFGQVNVLLCEEMVKSNPPENALWTIDGDMVDVNDLALDREVRRNI
ncbi:OLC1v1008012C1 [Oldenlandia corymbosa var. corymbosa]|uniref:OLC1v1008012C1 n=1 Tax=Oldenlandia corymbosa var. corymbosa TaxID=529605 RepID=A0AAV1DKK4_OLDCO|nr:OLC1v1008012C1 [Oldenlandia corymbosa var. corymbosa]